MLVIAVTKFTHGAWLVVLLIPLLVALFIAIHRHYGDVPVQLSLDGYDPPPPIEHTVLVLVGDLHQGRGRRAPLRPALSPTVKGSTSSWIPTGRAGWRRSGASGASGIPLVVLTSPYRSLLRPLPRLPRPPARPGRHHVVTIVIPEFIPGRWWQHLLHNQTALLIKGALLFRKRVVVVDVPFHLRG